MNLSDQLVNELGCLRLRDPLHEQRVHLTLRELELKGSLEDVVAVGGARVSVLRTVHLLHFLCLSK